MMANCLAGELQETIQRYADKHRHGVLDMEEITGSLAQITSAYFAEIPQTRERCRLFNKFIISATKQMNERAAGERR